MHIMDVIMDKLLPKTSQQISEREQATDDVIERSKIHKKTAEQAMFDAYKQAGVQQFGRRR